ncbi:FecR family protein [Alistipes sp.]|uniref:FecR family protein n=1 Tax=Alistipes sp. TaxID=1872444 RepID=UPI003AEF3DF0
MIEELLDKYVSGKTTEEEERIIMDWLDEDPGNQRRLNDLWQLQDTLAANTPPQRILRPKRTRRPLLRYLSQAAAVLVLCAGSWYFSHTLTVARQSRQFMSLTAPVGQRMNITLQDGTSVCLNSGARLEYPMTFGQNRRVRLTGEAMFEVEHDAEHPFVVETFACEVEVLGTKFNVDANEADGTFSAALLRGRLKVTNKLSEDDPILMAPSDMVCLAGNQLVLQTIANQDDYLWPEGILNLVGHSFIETISKLEDLYGVSIVIDRKEAPELDVVRGKIPVSMGLDYVLRSLQQITPFHYVRDEKNTIHIR